MNADSHEFDLQQFANLVLEDDPAVLAEVLQAADRLQEHGRHQQAAEVLERLAQRLAQPGCRSSPLARCHLFARLGGMRGLLGEFVEAEEWLRRAVALAEQARLSELSRRDFQRMLERLLENKAIKPTSIAPLESPRRVAETNETIVASATSTETVSGHMPNVVRRQNALQLLTAEQRQLLEWSGRERCSVDEIAEKLGLTCSEAVLRLSDAIDCFNEALCRLQGGTDAAEASAGRESAATCQPK